MKTKHCRTLKLFAGVGFCLLVAGGQTVDAQTNENKSELRRFFERDYLLGDWGGLRTDLSKRGVDFEFLYAASFPENLDGGLRRGGVYQGAALLTLDLDSQKLLGYEGGTLHAGSLWLHGQKPFSDRFVGDLNKVNLLDYNNGFRLWELYYQQKFFEGKLTVKAGQLDIARDFLVPEYYLSIASINFLNQTFWYPTMAFNVWDQPFFPVGHHGLTSTPFGSPGVLVRYEATPRCYVQAGVYDGLPDVSSSGTRINLNSEEGALAYFEAGYKLNADKDSSGPPGNYKIGGYYHTDDFFDMYQGAFAAFDNATGAGLGVFANPKPHHGNYGFYFLADQVLWREVGRQDPAMQGLIGFLRAAYAPPDRNLAQLGVDGGLVYRGLIPTRDWDTLGVAVSYLEMSDDLRDAQRDINAIIGFPVLPKADHETVIELSYKAQLSAWWTLQISGERVFHPGGRTFREIPDAWVFSIQAILRL